jgi:uncharacterized coiled-coil protein SlyX
LPKTIQGGNRPYPALITINGRGKDRSPKGLADDFGDLWFDDLVQAQAIRSSFLLESNAGFDRCSPHSLGLGDNGLRLFLSSLNGLLERGLFEPEQGEGQMWGQRNSKYAAAIGTQLLAKIHVLDHKIGKVDRTQNHPLDRLDDRLDFISDAAHRVGKVVDELNGRIDCQDLQIQQLADMVNDLVGKVEGQAKTIKGLKESREEQQKVINRMTAKVIALEQYTEDIQKKVFPKVRSRRAT